jgi:nicotinamidase-related amidase
LIEVNGKGIYTDLAEIVDPRHTALVLVDMQRDFVAPDGLFGTLGIDLSIYDEMLPRLAGLLAAARHHGVAVIPVQNTALAEGRSDSPAQVRFNLRMHAAARRGGPPLTYTVPGTPGHEFVRERPRRQRARRAQVPLEWLPGHQPRPRPAQQRDQDGGGHRLHDRGLSGVDRS